jgi:uncharacterized membrane protein YbhN (UPF0104 family)
MRVGLGARIAISVAAFAAVWWFIDPVHMLKLLAGAHLGWFAVSFFTNLAALYLAAQVLSLLCDRRVSAGAVFRVNLISIYFGTFMPGDIAAGLVSRIRYLGMASWQEVVHRTVIDRLISLATFSVIAAGAFMGSALLPAFGIVTLLLPLAVVVGAVLAIAIAREPALFVAKLPALRKLYAKLVPDTALPPLTLAPATFLWSIAAQLCMGAVTFAALRSLGAEVGLLDSIVVAYLLTLAQLVPLFFAGIGIRDVSAVTLLAHLGISAEVAVAFSTLILAIFILEAILGGLLQVKAEGARPNGAE